MMIQFILYVANQTRSTEFYSSILQAEPVLNTPGMTEFLVSPDCELGLMPEAGIAKIFGETTPHPSTGSGIPRCELYLSVEDAQNEFSGALHAGATSVDPVAPRDWGDTVGYVADPDGHIIAFAQRI